MNHKQVYRHTKVICNKACAAAQGGEQAPELKPRNATYVAVGRLVSVRVQAETGLFWKACCKQGAQICAFLILVTLGCSSSQNATVSTEVLQVGKAELHCISELMLIAREDLPR